MKKFSSLILTLGLLTVSFASCSAKSEEAVVEKTLTVAAAASLKNIMEEELIPLFEEKNSNVKIQGSYDSSGKLQTQIEEGAEVDVFMSAAMKQINYLDKKGYILENSILELLENKIVLISSKVNKSSINDFKEVVKSETIAVGDPESVPAGEYAKEVFENLNIWEEVLKKSSLGTNVTEVLTWVAEGSAEVGVVYSTDAASNEKVEVLAEAKEGTVSKIIYPVGIIKDSNNIEEAKLFVEFLNSEEAMKVFKAYGFTESK